MIWPRAGCGPAAGAGAGGAGDDRGQYQPAGRQDAERFAELGVFAEDETIPFSLVARLWRATAGLDDLQAAQVCKRLAQLALVSAAPVRTAGVTLHDVVRDFLRAELGQQRLAGLNGMLLDAVAAGLPAASPLDPAACTRRGRPGGNWGTRTGTCGITSSSTCWMPGGPAMRRPSR